MKKLFMIGIGGGMEQTNIEVHDIRFVAAHSIEDAYDILRRNWFGTTLHIDEYMIIEFIDNYKILLKDKPQESEDKLFFVNMGGSIKQKFGEAHEYSLLVATTKENAKHRSESELLINAYDRHIDYYFEVQERLESTDGKDVFIHLVLESENNRENNYYNTYIKL